MAPGWFEWGASMKLVMFDIDGTLTRSVHTNEQCFVGALRGTFGFENINVDWTSYPHVTDSGVLGVLFQERHARTPSVEEIAACQRELVSQLTAFVETEPVVPITGAREFVSALLENPDYAVSVASGAWSCSGMLKLAKAGLDFPGMPTGFSDDAISREGIMEVSMARALKACGREAFDSVIYVGDGVWDARACRNLGWPLIGIADEPAKIERLYAEGARHVFPDYLDAGRMMSAIGAV